MTLRMTLPVLCFAALAMGCGDKDDSTDSASGGGDDGGSSAACGTVHEVTTTDDGSDMEAYMDFSPEDLTIAVGDCVSFVMSSTHNAIEVSEDSYNSRDGTPLSGGFQVDYGETAEVYFGEAGTHYYVCQPHVLGDMIGTITVQ